MADRRRRRMSPSPARCVLRTPIRRLTAAPALSRLLLALTLYALPVLLPAPARATIYARHPGRWTPPDTNEANVAVHMALLPSPDTSVAHSKIVWWNESHNNPQAVLSGKVWNWKPIQQDACSSYPFSNFTTAQTLNAPATNVFCTGLQPTLDGRLFVCGGTETGEFGSRANWIFNPADGSWTSAGMMSQ